MQEEENEINTKSEVNQENKQEEQKEEQPKKKKVNNVLFVHGLDKRIDEQKLYEIFPGYQVIYIKIAKIAKTGDSLGYGFMGFLNHEKAAQCLKEKNYIRIYDRTIRLCWYDRDDDNPRTKLENHLFVKNIPREVTLKEFHEYFAQFGEIFTTKIAEDEEGDPLGYGYVIYKEPESTKKAIEEANGKQPWKNSKMKLYVAQLERNRPRKPPRFNNLYVKNIPLDWNEEKLKEYFSTYGEVSSLIIRSPNHDKLNMNTPNLILNFIKTHNYGFVCFKSIDGPAQNAANKVPYLKLHDEEYNKKVEEYAQSLRRLHIKEEDVYKCTCYIYEQKLEDKMFYRRGRKEIKQSFEALMRENNGFYVVRNLEDRLYCCQAMKKKDREKRLRILNEKLKNKVRARYKYCNLYVKNLPDDFNKNDLVNLFGKYGAIRSAKIIRLENGDCRLELLKAKQRVFAFVCFMTPEIAKKARKELNGKIYLKNGPRLFVDYHQTKKERLQFIKLQMLKKATNDPYNFFIKPILESTKEVTVTSPLNPPLPLPLRIVQDPNQPQVKIDLHSEPLAFMNPNEHEKVSIIFPTNPEANVYNLDAKEINPNMRIPFNDPRMPNATVQMTHINDPVLKRIQFNRKLYLPNPKVPPNVPMSRPNIMIPPQRTVYQLPTPQARIPIPFSQIELPDIDTFLPSSQMSMPQTQIPTSQMPMPISQVPIPHGQIPVSMPMSQNNMNKIMQQRQQGQQGQQTPIIMPPQQSMVMTQMMPSQSQSQNVQNVQKVEKVEKVKSAKEKAKERHNELNNEFVLMIIGDNKYSKYKPYFNDLIKEFSNLKLEIKETVIKFSDALEENVKVMISTIKKRAAAEKKAKEQSENADKQKEEDAKDKIENKEEDKEESQKEKIKEKDEIKERKDEKEEENEEDENEGENIFQKIDFFLKHDNDDEKDKDNGEDNDDKGQ